jgi:hypothetical protein
MWLGLASEASSSIRHDVLDIRHDVVEEPGRLARIVERHDVLVPQPGRDPDLAQEPVGPSAAASSDRSTFTATVRPCRGSSTR